MPIAAYRKKKSQCVLLAENSRQKGLCWRVIDVAGLYLSYSRATERKQGEFNFLWLKVAFSFLSLSSFSLPSVFHIVPSPPPWVFSICALVAEIQKVESDHLGGPSKSLVFG